MSMRHVMWVVVAAGCAGNGDPGGADAGAEEEVALTQVQARAVGQALAAEIEGAAKRYGPVGVAPSADATCTSSSGDGSDPDGDTIPVSAKLTFDCSERRLGFTGTLTGTESITDDEPAAAAWAFTADVDLEASLTGPFGGSIVTSTAGGVVASQGSLTGPFALTSEVAIAAVVTNVRGVSVEVAGVLAWTSTYAPELDWAPGGPVVMGTLAAEGALDLRIGAVSAEATLSTPTPLVMRPTCESRVTAGRVEATFASGAGEVTIAVEWSGCGQSDVIYAP